MDAPQTVRHMIKVNVALGEISGALYAPATLPLVKTLDLHRRLCGPHSQSDIMEKMKISWQYRDLNPELSSLLHSCCSESQSNPCG
jgi:hypothetical protein